MPPQSVTAFASARPPSLAELSRAANDDLYRVGFVLGEFIVSRWGRDGLRTLIQRNGNTQQAAGVGESEFVAGWTSFVSGRYLSQP